MSRKNKKKNESKNHWYLTNPNGFVQYVYSDGTGGPYQLKTNQNKDMENKKLFKFKVTNVDVDIYEVFAKDEETAKAMLNNSNPTKNISEEYTIESLGEVKE